MLKSKIFVSTIISFVVLFSAPLFVLADHTSTHNIEQLKAQISALQTQLSAMVAAQATSSDLTVGARGDNALALQIFLTTTGHYSGPITGYFGPLTRRAVIRFQEANSVPGTGYVGPLTRSAIQRSALSSTSTGSSASGTTLGGPSQLPPAQQKFKIGDRVITTDQVVVRAVPNPDSLTWIATQPKSVFGTVVEGPVSNTSNMTSRPTPLWFWRIDFDSGVDGWVTDNYLEKTNTAVCTSRPACLDSTPRCLITEPIGGWCSTLGGGGTSVDGSAMCTQEVKLCPDGSYVGRKSPTCEFAACPGSGTTGNSSGY